MDQFTQYRHAVAKQLCLTDKFEAIETPKGLKTTLYPHQAVVVKAMLAAEETRVVMAANKDYTDATRKEVAVQSSGMVLSEPFGTGKTIEILAMILARPVPKAIPEHFNVIKRSDYVGGPSTYMGFQREITRKFTGENALIRPNLIVVGSSVLTQWENAVGMFTDLKCLVIGSHNGLKKFVDVFKEGKLKAFDIVLLKNGTYTGFIDIPDNDSEDKSLKSLVRTVGRITRNHCWARVFYDDFDTINIPADAGGINALFSVYVSATKKVGSNVRQQAREYNNILEVLRNSYLPLNKVADDKVLFSTFNISNEKSFVEKSTSIPIINKYRYVYANPDDNYINLLGVMGERDASEVMEMLNGDAIATAAEHMGIKTTSIADIFQKMLNNKYEKYLHDGAVIETINNFKQYLEDEVDPDEDGRQHTVAEIDAILKSLEKKNTPKTEFYSEQLMRSVDDLKKVYVDSYDKNGVAIRRVIDNVKEGACQVCCLPLQDVGVFIVKCCGLIVCDECGIKGNQVGKQYDPITKQQTLIGSCANCKTKLYPANDMIFLDKNFNIEDILTARGDEKQPEPVVEEQPEEEKEETEEDKIKNPKLKALLNICRGEPPKEREVFNNEIPHLLEGRVDKPIPNDQKKKILLFANFDETLKLVETFLAEQNISYLHLGGTYQEMARTVAKFETAGEVLLVNSQHHCAGLNIQFATDLVFFHKIMDKNIESQVCGRAQRIGRKFNLNIHYLLYTNEKKLA